MGAQLSLTVADPKTVAELSRLQRAYDTSLALMILNLLLGFLPSTGISWIPYVGPWVQFGFILFSFGCSLGIYTLTQKTLPHNSILNRMQLAFYLLLLLVCMIGAIVQSNANRVYDECMANYYRPMYMPMPYAVPSINSTSGSDSALAAAAQPAPGVSSQSYMWPTCTLYAGASIVLNGIVVPVIGFIAMVLLSIQASRIWNTAQVKILSGSTRATEFRVPIEQFRAFQAWMEQTQGGSMNRSGSSLPMYQSVVPQSQKNGSV